MVASGSYDGQEHSRDGKLVMIVVGCAALLFGYFVNMEAAAGMLAGAFMGWWLTPDIDHRGMTHEEYRAIKRLGLLGIAWVAFWSPYSFFVPHRSDLSHGWFGTLGRYLYLMTPVWAMFYAILYALGQPLEFYWLFNVGMLGAWFIQDTMHYIRDDLV